MVITLGARQKECCARIQAVATAHGVNLYVVGGIVRDLLREADVLETDIDILVEGDALVFAATVQREIGGSLRQFPDFLTAKLSSPEQYAELTEIDFASSRTEIYDSPGKLPRVTAASIAEDLKRRDFSINAVALPLSCLLDIDNSTDSIEKIKTRCIDTCGGISDLEKRLIRILHPASFKDDPTRLFRALRYLHRIGGTFEERTEAAFSQAVSGQLLACISPRRQLNELVKILQEQEAGVVMSECASRGLLAQCFRGLVSNELGQFFAGLIQELACLPQQIRLAQQAELEAVALLILMESAPNEVRPQICQQFGVPRRLRAELERDLACSSSMEKADLYSGAGLIFCAVRHPSLRSWALEQIQVKSREE